MDIEEDDTYYLMESEALQSLSDFFGIDFKDMDEAMIFVRENNEKDDSRVWVNKYGLLGESERLFFKSERFDFKIPLQVLLLGGTERLDSPFVRFCLSLFT